MFDPLSAVELPEGASKWGRVAWGVEMLDAGLIDVPKARAFVKGTGHVSEETARSVVAQLAEFAPRLTRLELQLETFGVSHGNSILSEGQAVTTSSRRWEFLMETPSCPKDRL